MSETKPSAEPEEPAEAAPQEPSEAAAISMHVIQKGGDDGTYLLRTASGRYVKMAPSAYHLVAYRNSGVSFEAIAEGISNRPGGPETKPEEVRRAYGTIVAKLRYIDEQDSLTRSGFWLRWPLISESIVNRLTPLFGVFFRQWPATALLGLMLIAGVVFPQLFVSLRFTGESLTLGYGLLLISLLFHELGHASACSYFGARPRAIGFGIYLVYPVFYSDVSAAWELRPRSRVIVDVAGLYFQGIVGALYVLLYVWTDWEPLLVAILMIAGSSVFSLNPIFKFDGYWMIADALNVHNLSQQPGRIARHVWARLRGKRPEALPWKLWVTSVLSVYSVLSFSIWGLFLWFILPFFAARIAAYPEQAYRFFSALLSGQSPPATEFAISTYMFLLAAFILGRMTYGYGRKLWDMGARGVQKVSAALAKQRELAA